ncbi:hypothetical protein CSUI_009420 [Cystoisospora suis]|uniref:Uncharacterized protein n=1 Tax=Cystoisospora suis TaxID=483139 RepID=A0A2C6KK67_9APIC|nr:hypothetical protein CSUI_009420 [Cystoisospora suis]
MNAVKEIERWCCFFPFLGREPVIHHLSLPDFLFHRHRYLPPWHPRSLTCSRRAKGRKEFYSFFFLPSLRIHLPPS